MLSPASVCTPGVGVGTSHVSWVRSHSRVPHDIRSGDSLCYWHLVVITGDRFKLVQFSTVQGPPRFIMRHVRLISWWLASYWNAVLLPPANEVWGKVIFLHLSLWVILFKVEGGICIWVQGGVCLWVGRVHPPGHTHHPWIHPRM